MDLQKRKLELIQAFIRIQSEDVIAQLERIISKEKIDSNQDKITPLSAEEFNKRIDQSMKDSQNGNLIESNELKSIIEKWG
jgi:hypothetical protein